MPTMASMRRGLEAIFIQMLPYQFLCTFEEDVANFAFEPLDFAKDKPRTKSRRFMLTNFAERIRALRNFVNSGLDARSALRRDSFYLCPCGIHSNRSRDSARKLNRKEWTTNRSRYPRHPNLCCPQPAKICYSH